MLLPAFKPGTSNQWSFTYGTGKYTEGLPPIFDAAYEGLYAGVV